uniref:Uncharacterized protein n=1 Tax=Pseudomonas phage HRDY3 TaxID=3236930 RepID=A0AB39CE78_9VIRU
MQHFMTVYVDGKPEQRELDHVEVVPRGKLPRLVPKLREDEEMRRTSDGKVIVFKTQKTERFLTSVIADWNGGEHQTYTAEYSDGSTEQWTADQFYAWKAAEREW